MWSHLHGSPPFGTSRGVLAESERPEVAAFAAVLRRAKAAGFVGRHRVIDSRERDTDDSAMTLTRDIGDVTEVVVLYGKWGEAFRVPKGAAPKGAMELEEEPGRLLDLVLAGQWDAQPSTRDNGDH